MINPLTALLVVAAMATKDSLYCLWVRRAAAGRALEAAGYGSGIMLASSFVTLTFVHNPWYIPFVMLGAALGSYITITVDHKHGK